MRLAAHLGIVDVDNLAQTITQEAAVEWIAYMTLEPLPADRIELQNAGIASVFAGALAGKGKGPKPEDFMVVREPKQQQSQATMGTMMRTIARGQ